jgi:hypothetical protein
MAKKKDKKKNRILKKLEKEIVNQEKYSGEEIDETERGVQEDKAVTSEALGIEEDEEKGEEPYPEIAQAEKDPDEEEEN